MYVSWLLLESVISRSSFAGFHGGYCLKCVVDWICICAIKSCFAVVLRRVSMGLVVIFLLVLCSFWHFKFFIVDCDILLKGFSPISYC